MCLIHFSLNLSRTKAVHYSFLTWIRKYHHHKYCWIFQSTYFLSLYIVLVTPPVDKNKNYFQLVFLWGVLTEEWGDDQSYIILPTKRFYVATLGSLLVFTFSFHWSLKVFSLLQIGHCNYFGISVMTPNQKALNKYWVKSNLKN